jgi:hypothetical protein
MNTEKTMSIFRSEKDKEEFMRVFRKITMSGDINDDRAVEKIMRDYPQYFHQATPDDIAKISRSELNSDIRRRARQPNKLADDIFRGPTDKQKPS